MPVKEKAPPPKEEALPGESERSVDRFHNEPPLEERVAMEFREQLLSERPQFLIRRDDMIAAAERCEVVDEETLGKAGDLIKLYRAATGHITETHKAVKQPYLDGGRAADAEKKRLLDPIEDARVKVQGMMNSYQTKLAAERRAEEERRRAEERRQAEEAAKAEEGEAVPVAAAAPSKPEPVRSDAGATVSGKTVWNSEVEDYTVAFVAVEDDEKVRIAIDQAIARRVRAGTRKIEGVRIWPTQQAVAR